MNYRLLFILFIWPLAEMLCAQTVNCSRTAILTDGEYELSGSAILERFDDGSIQLRLGNDFRTESGPDVQVFLSNDSTSIAGAIMLEDIGTVDGISHFRGALNIPIEEEITMDQYEFVVLRCITFRAFWGGGRLSAPTCDDPGEGGGNNGGGNNGGGNDSTEMCLETIVATTNWASEVTVCPNDGEANVVELKNTQDIPAGDEYAYVITDLNNRIRVVHFQDSYDFEGSSLETEYVFGVSYRGDLVYQVGDFLNSMTASECIQLSDAQTFLTVIKDNCGQAFDCVNTITATTNWATEASVCGDGSQSAIVPLLNNQFLTPGQNYAYLVTNEANELIEVFEGTEYDFGNSGFEINRVFGISYNGTLNATIGNSIFDITADDCFILSDTSLFLTILKTGCAATTRSVSGMIENFQGTPIEGATVRLSDGQSTTSDIDGTFSFVNVATDMDLDVKATFSDNVLNGVSATDLVLTARHIINVRPLSNPYQLIAADASNDGRLSVTDLLQVRNLLVNRTDGFANNSSWRFVQKSDASLEDFEIVELVPIPAGVQDVTGVTIIGVKIGDVNGNADTKLSQN